MSIPKNISPAHIRQAINEISLSDIPKSRESYVYFLKHNDKKLPPKYVVSIANKHANGEELSSEDFNAVQAVYFLESSGFVVEKTNKLVNIKLYDIHGSSALENYNSLITKDDKYFYWDSKRFSKYRKEDVVFWINRRAKVALFTRVDSVQIKPQFSNGRNLINDLGYDVYANAQSATQFENFYRFRIEKKINIPDDWEYKILSPFNGQTMAIILYENKVNVPLKKLDKINDIKRLFNKNDEVVDLLELASSLLEEKLTGNLKKVKDDFKRVKGDFLKFMSNIHKNPSTSKDYVKMMPKIERWFIENNIATKDYIIWRDINQIEEIEDNLNGAQGENWKQKNKKEHNWYGSPWNMWVKYNRELHSNNKNMKVEEATFDNNAFSSSILNSGLFYDKVLLNRFVSSLITKPFVILTGLSGSGKTKLAQAYAQWICQDESQYSIIPVGADWTNREPLLGYPNALETKEYIKPDNNALDLIMQANNHPELPYFLILDEMNLSHVERYFADFLSVMESKEGILLYDEGTERDGVPSKLEIPSNLFIIGTVNIDETTNMFSPKVLDRANTIEFRVTANEMKGFLGNIKEVKIENLNTKGAGMAKSFLEMSANKSFATKDLEVINNTLLQFFGELKKTGAEFGYRSATEILRLIHQLTVLDDALGTDEKIDIAIMQKLLPKLHGSRRKLCPVLITLGSFCIEGDIKIEKEVFEKEDFDFKEDIVLYPLSLEKIKRMYKGAIDNGFASFAEA